MKGRCSLLQCKQFAYSWWRRQAVTTTSTTPSSPPRPPPRASRLRLMRERSEVLQQGHGMQCKNTSATPSGSYMMPIGIIVATLDDLACYGNAICDSQGRQQHAAPPNLVSHAQPPDIICGPRARMGAPTCRPAPLGGHHQGNMFCLLCISGGVAHRCGLGVRTACTTGPNTIHLHGCRPL
jgi:hypothetical protein